MLFDFCAIVKETSACEAEADYPGVGGGKTELNCCEWIWIEIGCNGWQSLTLTGEHFSCNSKNALCRNKIGTTSLLCKPKKILAYGAAKPTWGLKKRPYHDHRKHSPAAFFAFLSSFPLRFTCCVKLKGQLRAKRTAIKEFQSSYQVYVSFVWGTTIIQWCSTD